MTVSYQVLGQAFTIDPATPTALFTVPENSSAVVSSLTVCDVGGNGGTWSVTISIDGAGTAVQQFIYGSAFFGRLLDANDTFVATIGITLGAGDAVNVIDWGGNAIAFNLFGALYS